MTADTLLGRLEKVTERGRGNWVARCPAHDDNGPSLSVRELPDGTTLIHCFAGCNAQEVVESVGLTLGDLFPERMEHWNNHRRGRPRINGWDVIRALRRHVTVVLLASDQLRRGEALSDEDAETLCGAAAEIERIVRESHVVA